MARELPQEADSSAVKSGGGLDNARNNIYDELRQIQEPWRQAANDKTQMSLPNMQIVGSESGGIDKADPARKGEGVSSGSSRSADGAASDPKARESKLGDKSPQDRQKLSDEEEDDGTYDGDDAEKRTHDEFAHIRKEQERKRQEEPWKEGVRENGRLFEKNQQRQAAERLTKDLNTDKQELKPDIKEQDLNRNAEIFRQEQAKAEIARLLKDNGSKLNPPATLEPMPKQREPEPFPFPIHPNPLEINKLRR